MIKIILTKKKKYKQIHILVNQIMNKICQIILKIVIIKTRIIIKYIHISRFKINMIINFLNKIKLANKIK